MKRAVLLVVALVLAALLMHRATTLAQGTLDQSNTGNDANPAFIPPSSVAFAPYAQTFTAGITGTMDAAAIEVAAPVGGETISVSIYATSGGLPTGVPLATATVAIPLVPAPPPVPLTIVTFAPGVPVVAGTLYALVFSNLQPSIAVAALAVTQTDSYPRGTALISPTGATADFFPVPVDFYFQTFVTPAPTVINAVYLASLTVQTTGCGSVSPASPIDIFPGQNEIVTAVPCAGSIFSGWSGGPCDKTRIDPCDVNVGTSQTITAHFTP